MFGKITFSDYCNNFSEESRTSFAQYLGAYALDRQWNWQWDLWRDAWLESER